MVGAGYLAFHSLQGVTTLTLAAVGIRQKSKGKKCCSNLASEDPPAVEPG